MRKLGLRALYSGVVLSLLLVPLAAHVRQFDAVAFDASDGADRAMTAPALPAGMDSWTVQRLDGSETLAVSIADAASLVGLKMKVVEAWIAEGKLEFAVNPQREKVVLVDALWEALPPALKEP